VYKDRPMSRKTAPNPINPTTARRTTNLTGEKSDGRELCASAIDVRKSVNELFRFSSWIVKVSSRFARSGEGSTTELRPLDTPTSELAAEFIC
jgi:hypothetical protein